MHNNIELYCISVWSQSRLWAPRQARSRKYSAQATQTFAWPLAASSSYVVTFSHTLLARSVGVLCLLFENRRGRCDGNERNVRRRSPEASTLLVCMLRTAVELWEISCRLSESTFLLFWKRKKAIIFICVDVLDSIEGILWLFVCFCFLHLVNWVQHIQISLWVYQVLSSLLYLFVLNKDLGHFNMGVQVTCSGCNGQCF